MKRILFVLDYFPPHVGGSEYVFGTLTKELVQRGYEIDVLTSHYDPALPRVEEINGVTVYRTGKTRFDFIFKSIQKARKLKKKYDAVHTASFVSILPAWIISHILGSKRFMTIHEVFGPLRIPYKGFAGIFYRMVEKILGKLPFDAYICVSSSTLKRSLQYRNTPQTKVHVVYNGIDTERRNKSITQQRPQAREELGLDDKFVLCYSGHAGTSKGIDYVLKAFGRIHELIPNTHLIANILPGSRQQKIIKQLGELQHQTQSVSIYTGVSEQKLKTLVAASDTIIVPSISEGFGLMAAEVSQTEIPLIVSKTTALPEVVGGNVIFIQPGSAKEIVDAALKAYRKDRTSLPLKTFSRKQTVDKYCAIYDANGL